MYYSVDDDGVFCVRLAPPLPPPPYPVRLLEARGDGDRLVLAIDDEGAEVGGGRALENGTALEIRRHGGGVWVVGWATAATGRCCALAVGEDRQEPPLRLEPNNGGCGVAHQPPPLSPLRPARLLRDLLAELEGRGALPDPAVDRAAFARRYTACHALLEAVGAYRAHARAGARLRRELDAGENALLLTLDVLVEAHFGTLCGE